MELHSQFNQIYVLQSSSVNLLGNKCKLCQNLSITIRTLLSNIISKLEIKTALSKIDLEKNCSYDNNMKYFSIFAIKCSKDDLFGYVADIILRLQVKSLNEIGNSYATIFSRLPDEHLELLIMLRNMLKQSLENNTNIYFSTKLSSRSIDALVTNCLLLYY